MAQIPPIFRKSGEGAVASYNYLDLADNTGMALFYAATSSNGDVLTQNQVYSGDIELGGLATSGGWTIEVDKDYDLTQFNAPRVIKGTALLNYCFGIDPSANAYMWLYLKKWDGSTETIIGNLSGARLIHNGTGNQIKTELLPMPLTETNFKKGEVLRLSVHFYMQDAHGGQAWYGVDPMNRDGTFLTPSTTEITTQFKCWIPFDLDL